MLNKPAKIMLVATSLAPVLGAFGMISYSSTHSIWIAAQWFLCAILLLLLCWLVLLFAERKGERESVTFRSFRNVDREVLTFLLIYLLPLIAKDSLPAFQIPVAVYVFLVIAWAVYHSNAFFFNPLLGLLGYHFYAVESRDGVPHVLITRDTIRVPSATLEVIQLFDHTYLMVDNGRES